LLERTGFGYADANASWSSVGGQLVVVIDAPIKLLAVVTAVSVPMLVSALVSALALHLKRALGLMKSTSLLVPTRALLVPMIVLLAQNESTIAAFSIIVTAVRFHVARNVVTRC
jgi:hypothetical protein